MPTDDCSACHIIQLRLNSCSWQHELDGATNISIGKLPTVVIAGFQKCGTSALHEMLITHPDVSGACMDPGDPDHFSKEVHFFDRPDRFQKGIDWYKERFVQPSVHTIDATPEYIRSPDVIKRMASTLPNAKIILLMRDPVERAYSAWNHWLQSPDWKVPLPDKGFDDNIAVELDLYKQNRIQASSMLVRGFYVVHIANLYRYYQPDQVYLGYSTHLNDDQDGELAKLFAFLGLQNYPIPRTVSHARSYEAPMREVTRNLLREIYRPFDEQLAKLLGAQPPWMDE